MKTSELSSNGIYAIKPRTYDEPKPALLIEAGLWMWSDSWGYWDGAETRTSARVFTRAEKGERAGASKGWGRSSWEIGLPVLTIGAHGIRFSRNAEEHSILTKPFQIFTAAMEKMHLLDLFAEGHDGRATGSIKTSVEVEVELVGGGSENIRVSLEFVRPQAIVTTWNVHVEEKRKADVARVDFETKQAERKAENEKTAYDIVSRVSQLTGEPKLGYRYDGERYDLHRKTANSGISTTYEVSEELLLKLLALAEKESAS